MGQDSSVGIATHYGQGGPGIYSRWGKIFRTHPDQPWGPPSLLYNGYWVSFHGVKWPGHGVDHQPTSYDEAKERVELYIYSLSGPSWPVLGWTLPKCVLVGNTMPWPLSPQELHSTHYVGGWVGLQAGLDGCRKAHPHQDSIPGPSSL
jgi:hypothetical protein